LRSSPVSPARQRFALRLRGDNGASAFGPGAEPGAELAISGEYSTGMIRVTLIAIPRRAVVGPPRQPSSPAKPRLPGHPLLAEGFGFLPGRAEDRCLREQLGSRHRDAPASAVDQATLPQQAVGRESGVSPEAG
jgi:hypothetical protein